jgi:threonyl-tRNA synthetase
LRQPSGKNILVSLPNGASFEGRADELTPLEIIKSLKYKEPYVFANVRSTAEGSSLAHIHDADSQEEVAGNNSEGWILQDLFRPLETDCELNFLEFKDAKSAFWHSSAHVLGSAIEEVYGDESLLTVGPSTKDGFFYDFLPGTQG